MVRRLLHLCLCGLILGSCVRVSPDVAQQLQNRPDMPVPGFVRDVERAGTPGGMNSFSSAGFIGAGTALSSAQSSSSVSVYYPPRNSSTSSQWHAYRNGEFGFTLQFIGTILVENQKGYTRIQNYDDAPDRLFLNTGEYYLEIYIANKEDVLPEILSCKARFPGAATVKAGAATAYRVDVPPAQGSNQTQFVLCVERSQGTVFFTITENNTIGSIANTILKTVNFTQS